MIYYLIGFFLCRQFDCHDAYLNVVLESQNYSHYYLSIKTKTENGESEIVVLNYNLYEFLRSHDSCCFDIGHYRDFIKSKLAKNEPINLKSSDLENMQATLVVNNPQVMDAAIKGEDYFINRYFVVTPGHNYARLKNNIPINNYSAIVRQLFNWSFLVETNESKIELPDLNFCNSHLTKGINR